LKDHAIATIEGLASQALGSPHEKLELSFQAEEELDLVMKAELQLVVWQGHDPGEHRLHVPSDEVVGERPEGVVMTDLALVVDSRQAEFSRRPRAYVQIP
jgi:hypothetical protein